ncbi:hypothetical protein PAEPH01_2104 [Pancytospora epiphaga]|nr:hypothetical protein PAEPH01_2104 [Pancytospora epiphaga]
MSIEEPINEYRLYDASEQFLSLVAPLSAEDSLYEYSNFVFLHHFLRSPSPLITADSIRVRFSGQFFFFLAQEQLIRVLIVLLENKLELSNEDQKEFIEMIFGCIDYSSEKIITKEEVVTIVEAMMRSNVPDYFEYVFLTWKMWYSFTIEEQEKMLKNAKKEYKREILVMLYLFVMNRDEDNSQQCEIFKNDVKNQYKEFSILKNGHSLKDIVIKGAGWNDRIFCTILDTFDTCLLDIPEVFKSLDNNTIILFRNFFRIQFFPRYHKYLNFKNLRYRSHTCYALTTFTRELEEVNGIGESNDVETNSRLYFDPLRIKNEFGTWIRMMKKSNNLSGTITVEEYKKVFINAFAIIRQIMHSDNFNYKIFLKIFNNSAFGQYYNRPYVTLLFSLINEGVFDDLTKSQEWAECIDEETGRFYKHQFISDILSVNMGYGRVVDPLDTIKEYITRIHGFLSKLNTKDTIIMHREHFFFQHLLFHPRLNLISGTSILYYMEGLKKIGWANSREKCDQITRDLFFNDYYYEFAMELKNKVAEIENEPWIRKFKESIERELEIYKNEEDIKKERKNFYKC